MMNNNYRFAALGCVLALFVSWPLQAQLISAELGYIRTTEEVIEVTLVTFSDCSSTNQAPSQGVSFFEGYAGMPKLDLELTLFSSETVESVLPLQCGIPEQNCFVKAIYKNTFELPHRDDGYDLVWQAPEWGTSSFTNIEPIDAGLSLIIPISLADDMPESTPSISSNPLFLHCASKESAPSSVQVNLGEAERFELEFAAPFTAISEKENMTASVDPIPAMPADPADVTKTPFPEQPPVYMSVKYQDGYSAEAPLGKGNIKYDKKMGTLQMKSDTPGTFLVGETITTFKNKTKIAENQRVTRVTFLN